MLGEIHLQTNQNILFHCCSENDVISHTQRLRTQLEFSITAEIFETQSAGFFGKNPKSNIVFLIISWVWEHQKMNWRALKHSKYTIFNCLRKKKEEETGVEGGDGGECKSDHQSYFLDNTADMGQSFQHMRNCSFTQYFLRAFYLQGTEQDAKDTGMNKTDMISCP